MRKFLLDSSCFIQVANTCYSFDFCPGFWDWLIHYSMKSNILSIDRIKVELLRQNDALSTWATSRGDDFFLPTTDYQTLSEYRSLVGWANSNGFRPQAINTFLGCADSWLIAYAKANDFTIIANESRFGNKVDLKMPSVCDIFGVGYANIYDLLKETGAKLKI